MNTPLTGVWSGGTRLGGTSVRHLMTVSVAAALPVGIAYGIAILWLASPELISLDLAEQGTIVQYPSPLATVIGALALATGLSLVVTPLCRILARSTVLRAVLGSGLLGIAFVLLAVRAGVVGDVSSPYAAEVASRLRTGALLANAVLCAGLALAIPLALRERR